MRTHFLPDHPLRHDLVTQILLELFIGCALRFGRFLQFFHGLELHFLAHFVEALDEFGVTCNAQVLTFLQQKLLINQIAENILLLIGKVAVGVGGILLLHFLFKLVTAPDVFRAGDDFIVYPGDDLFDHGVGRRKRWKEQCVSNCQSQGGQRWDKSFRLHLQ